MTVRNFSFLKNGSLLHVLLFPFLSHPKSKGQSYFGHFLLAMSVAIRLLISSLLFSAHAVLPLIPIATRFNLDATIFFLTAKNQSIATAREASRSIKP